MSDMYFQNLPSTSTPITAENLNKLNDVKSSANQPSTGEKVWIQKGKNLLNKNEMGTGNIIYPDTTAEILNPDQKAYTTNWIPCNPNTQYTASGGNRERWQFKNASGTITFAEGYTITTPADAKFMRWYGYYDDNNTGISNVNLQIEQGSIATSYEPYIEPTIYVKNNNGVYERFYNKQNGFKNLLGDGAINGYSSGTIRLATSLINVKMLIFHVGAIGTYNYSSIPAMAFIGQYGSNLNDFKGWRVGLETIRLTFSIDNTTTYMTLKILSNNEFEIVSNPSNTQIRGIIGIY